jgi:F1F0 ATPase subunit 2
MVSTDILLLVASFFAGVGLGIFFFGALWITVAALPRLKHPIAVAGLSFLVRLAVVAVVLYLLGAGGQWLRLLAALVGFLIARSVLVAIVRRKPYGHAAGEPER